ncbi:MAG: alpha/beta fold hydrolase [Anaerolineae bacterium]
MPLAAERVFFASRGAIPLQLEGMLHRPGNQANRGPAVVLCHPHSLLGGSMQVPVIVATAEELAGRGLMAFRFNFRGVGRSEGEFGEGVAEVADVGGAVDFLLSQKDVDPERVYLMGYSFGAFVGLRHVEEDPRIAAIVALCLPLGSMATESFDQDFWSSFTKPKLFLAGDRDHVCPLSELRALAGSLPEPKELIVLEGADHFLWGREEEIARDIAGFLAG